VLPFVTVYPYFVGADLCVRPPNVNSNGRTQSAPTTNISNLIKGFKATVTKQINQYQKTLGMPVWQRGFYDRIIHNEEALIEIQQYIINNPAQWAFDENNSCRGDS
jgi:REP element-mobilizing transposase RayT